MKTLKEIQEEEIKKFIDKWISETTNNDILLNVGEKEEYDEFVKDLKSLYLVGALAMQSAMTVGVFHTECEGGCVPDSENECLNCGESCGDNDWDLARTQSLLQAEEFLATIK